MRDLVAIFTGPTLIAFCWCVSLRRTPSSLLWFVFCLFFAIGDVALGFSFADEPTNITLTGEFAALVGLAAGPGMAVMCVEACALDKGEIKFWREKHGKKKLEDSGWIVEATQVQARWDAKGGVAVSIRNGDTERHIGIADPIDDPDEFMNLQVQAQQAAETYNAHKIGA